MKVRMIVVLATALFVSQAYATSDNNKTVGQVGVVKNTGNTPSEIGYLTAVEGLSVACTYGPVYFDLSTSVGKGMQAVALTAKASGIKVRIDYAQDSNGLCWATVVALM